MQKSKRTGIALRAGQLAGILGFLAAPGLFGQETHEPQPSAIEIERDVEYGHVGDHALKLDIYRLASRGTRPAPVILMIHGGGWRAWPDGRWTKETDADVARAFAGRGYLVFSIDYRLSDVARFPAAVLDCKRAVRWIRSKEEQFHLDPDRLGVWGFSAGAHLALLLGCTTDRSGFDNEGVGTAISTRVQAVSAWAPLTDLADPSGPRKLVGECKDLAERFIGGSFEAKADIYRRASPITYVASGNAPTLLVHGEQDTLVPLSHSELMASRLRDVGVEATLLTVKGAGHLLFGEAGQQPPLSGLLQANISFFDRHLKPPKVLFFTQSAGYVHDVVKRPAPDQHSLVEQQLLRAVEGQIDLEVTQDPGTITAEHLRQFAAVVFYTSGELPIDKEALLGYVRSGGGFVCVHNGMATLMKYPPYGEMVGAEFDGHPWNQEITITVEDLQHPSTSLLGATFRVKDEIYQVKNWQRKNVHVLLSVEPGSVDLSKGKRADRDYALAWTKSYGKGRVFYTALGHFAEVWKDERFLKHLVGGIRWASGVTN